MGDILTNLLDSAPTDPRVQMLSEADQRRYVMILFLTDWDGRELLDDDTAAFMLRISIEEYQKTKGLLVFKGLIDEFNKPIQPREE